jgi:general secretion pathway protein K
MNRRPGGSRLAQRGVALITAVLMVALATILAVEVGFRGFLDQRRTGTLFAIDQAYEISLGAEAWAADFLKKDLQESQTDHLGEAWARPLPPLPIDGGGTVAGRLEDLQGRFNVNNLVNPDGTTNEAAVKQLERIFAALQLEPGWAIAIADWIDSDTQPGFPDGAEDSVYTGQDPPHLTANMPVTRVSELMVLPEFGAERFARVRPYLAALPAGSKLNVCTAPGIVLDSLSEGTSEFGLDPKNLEVRRKDACFPTLEDLRGALGDAAFNELRNSLTESSSYFRATLWVTIGTTEFTLYSLLARSPGSVRPVLRSFGSE